MQRSALSVTLQVVPGNRWIWNLAHGIPLHTVAKQVGEALRREMQFEFTNTILESAMAAGLHTCIENCGYATPERIFPINNLDVPDGR